MWHRPLTLIYPCVGAGNRFTKALKKKNKELESFEVDPDPLLNFAISYLVMSSPQVQVFNSSIITQQIRAAASNYISANILIKHVSPPFIFIGGLGLTHVWYIV